MDTFHMMPYAMRDQAVTANRMIERVERQAEENPSENPRRAGAD